MTVSKRLRYEILKRDGHRCFYCGRGTDVTTLTVDHVHPVALGGTDDPTNLVAACADCNGGKSSVPADAPLAAAISDKALVHAEAIRQVIAERAAQRTDAKKLYAKFDRNWKGWKNWRGETFAKPAAWRTTIDQVLNEGLDMDDLLELTDVAMESKAKDSWKYFCGCCWNRIRQMQDRAAEIVKASSPIDPHDARNYASAPLTVNGMPTMWTTEDVEDYYSQNLSYAEEWCREEDFECVSCRHIISGGGHCADTLCMVQYSTTLHWVAEVREAQYRRNAVELEELVSG